MSKCNNPTAWEEDELDLLFFGPLDGLHPESSHSNEAIEAAKSTQPVELNKFFNSVESAQRTELNKPKAVGSSTSIKKVEPKKRKPSFKGNSLFSPIKVSGGEDGSPLLTLAVSQDEPQTPQTPPPRSARVESRSWDPEEGFFGPMDGEAETESVYQLYKGDIPQVLNNQK